MDLKALKSLLKVMRDNGVSHLRTSDIELTLTPEALLPQKAKDIQEQNEIPSENPYSAFPDGILTDEQLAYYSAGGDPSEDPYRKDS